ncbi:hypothetical protein H4582DRAFT_2131015 [Lactarius indigo]|nr:hypothetical protein H4582DRAFT_2131015 [Lactarius indigo]
MSDDSNPSAMFVRWPYNTFFYALAATGPWLSSCSETSPMVPSPSYEFTTGMRRSDPSLPSPILVMSYGQAAKIEYARSPTISPPFRTSQGYFSRRDNQLRAGDCGETFRRHFFIILSAREIPGAGRASLHPEPMQQRYELRHPRHRRARYQMPELHHSIEMTGNEIIVRTISLLDGYPPPSFLNSRLYDNGAVTLYDITVGSNTGCNTVDTLLFVGSCYYVARNPNLYQLLDVLCFVIGK